jgi:hypothetical protein
MRTRNLIASAAFLAAVAMTSAFAQVQTPRTVRLHGVIEKVDGNTVMAKSDKGAEITLHLADKVRVTAVTKASVSDIKDGSFIGSGAMPQPDGSQKAVEVHIFAESMRGNGEGHRPWNGAPNGTMTNGTVGSTVTGVDGPVITVKYNGGEKKIIVGPNTPVVAFQPGDLAELKPGAAFTVIAAVEQPDGTFNIGSINVGSGGAIPP